MINICNRTDKGYMPELASLMDTLGVKVATTIKAMVRVSILSDYSSFIDGNGNIDCADVVAAWAHQVAKQHAQ